MYGRECHHALRRAWSGACKVLYATNLQNQVVYSTYPRPDFDQASLGSEELLQNSLQDPHDNRVYFGDTGMPLKHICEFAAFRLFGIVKRKKCLGLKHFDNLMVPLKKEENISILHQLCNYCGSISIDHGEHTKDLMSIVFPGWIMYEYFECRLLT